MNKGKSELPGKIGLKIQSCLLLGPNLIHDFTGVTFPVKLVTFRENVLFCEILRNSYLAFIIIFEEFQTTDCLSSWVPLRC